MTIQMKQDERRSLAAMIAQALAMADQLDLALVGISLNGALERLTGEGIAADAGASAIH